MENLRNVTAPSMDAVHAGNITACFRNVDKRISTLENQAGEIGALLAKTKIRQYRQARKLTIYGLEDPTSPEEAEA